MELQASTGTFVKATATGNQTVTQSGPAFTGALVILWADYGTAAEGSGASFRQCIGAATSSVAQFALSSTEGNGYNPSRTARRFHNDRCFQLADNGGVATAGASFVSFANGSFTVNWINATEGALRINYLVLGGAGVECSVGTFLGNTATGAQNITLTGHTTSPAAILSLTGFVLASDLNTVAVDDACCGLGFATTTAAAANSYFGDDFVSPMNEQSGQSTSHLIHVIDQSLAVVAQAAVSAVTASQLTLDWITAPATQRYHGYIAIGGVSARVGIFAQPSAAGAQTIAGGAFAPIVNLFSSAGKVAGSSATAHTQHMLGCAVDAANECVAAISSTDGTASSQVTRYRSNAKCIAHISGTTPTLNAAAEFTANNTDGFTLNWMTADATAREHIFLSLGDPSAAAIITPSGIPGEEAHGTPVLSPGPVSLLPAAIPSDEALGAPGAQPGAVSLSPPGIPGAEALGAALVGAGPVSILAAGIVTAESLGAPGVQPGVVSLSPPAIPGAEALGAALVGAGPVSVLAPGIATAEAIGLPALAGSGVIQPSPIPSDESLGAPGVQPGAVSLSPPGIPGAEALGAALVGAGPVSVLALGVATAEALGLPALAGSGVIQPSSIPSGELLGALVVQPGAVSLSPSAISSAEVIGSHVAQLGPGGTVTLYPAGIASAEQAGSPMLSAGAVALQPAAIASGEAIGAPVLTSATVLLPTGIASVEAVGNAVVLRGAVIILPAGITSIEQIGALTIIGGVSVIGYLEALVSIRPALLGAVGARPALTGEVRVNVH